MTSTAPFTLHVATVTDESYPLVAFYGWTLYDSRQEQIAHGKGETDYEEEALTDVSAGYLALSYSLANCDSDGVYSPLTVRIEHAPVVSALEHNSAPTVPRLVSLWNEIRRALTEADATIVSADPGTCTDAQMLAAKARAVFVYQDALLAQTNVQIIKEWLKEWESVKFILQDMMDEIEEAGMFVSRPWIARDVAFGIDRELEHFAPIIRAYEDTKPIIIGGGADTDSHEDGTAEDNDDY